MIIRILGAVLIVSGSYLSGVVFSKQEKMHCSALRRLEEMFRKCDRLLREERMGLHEVFEQVEEPGTDLLNGKLPEGLNESEESKLLKTVAALQTLSYRECLSLLNEYIDDLHQSVAFSEKKNNTAGKALPLVTGALGFMLAVFLF